MRKTAWEIAPWYRSDFTIFGREGEDDGGTDNSGADGDDDADDDDSDDDADEDDAEDDTDEKSKKSDTAALRKALREERAARKALEKDKAARDKAAARQKKGEENELTTLKHDHEEATTKLGRLAAGFLTAELNTAIREEARSQKFRDPSDALALISREDLDFEQDEDDPSKVEIDADSVKDALKALARKKPHLIASGTDDDGPTGSTGIGRGRKKGSGERTVEDYRNMGYSAL